MAAAMDIRLVDVLSAATRELVETLDASACGISRVIGDMLILIAEHATDGRTLQLGQGYLVSDFPETDRVLSSRQARTLTVDDRDVDSAEEVLLRTLGYGALLMLPLVIEDEVWGLVEVYRVEVRAFSADEMRRAATLLANVRH
jgi:GAF domain-containing protein